MRSTKTTKVNQSLLKDINRKKILRVIYDRKQSSRAEIKHLIKQDGKTVTNITNSLIKDGMIMAGGFSVFTGGRRRELLVLNPSYGFVVGIYLDVNFLIGVVTDFQSKVLLRERIPVSPTESKASLISKIRKTIDFLIKTSKIPPEKLLGIGFVANGFYDQEAGKWLLSVNNLHWKDVPIVSLLQQQWPVPVYLEDCSRALALGEKWFGIARDKETFLCLDIGTGIGCAIFQENRLYKGASNVAGELGHTIVVPDGDPCSCGNRGCLESVASGWALVRKAKCLLEKGEKTLLRNLCGNNPNALEADMILQAARQGDHLAMELLRPAGKYLGMAIANMINLLNPELVIISGHFSTSGDFALLALREHIKRFAMPDAFAHAEIAVSPLGEEAAILGATTLVHDRFFHIQPIGV